MVHCGTVLGLFLLSALTPAVWTEMENLLNIIQFLQTKYGSQNQFALAINVQQQKCSEVAVPGKDFLPDDEPRNVKNAMNSIARVYKGKQMIGAKPKPIPSTQANYHSEYLLLVKSNPPAVSPDDPLMQKLLLNDQNGCAIFYTFNSPCVRTCSTPDKTFSIISALDAIQSHGGLKAFVFNRVWHYDDDTQEWENNIKAIDAKVPLYRCDKVCTRCVNNGVVEEKCKSNKH